MDMYIVGECYKNFMNPGTSGAMFEIVSNEMAHLLIFDGQVTENKKNEFNNAENVELRMHYYRNIILLATKVGIMDWLDMVYTPQRTMNLELQEIIDMKEEGVLGICIIYIDSNIGKVEGIKFISSTNEFYKGLVKSIKQKIDEPFSLMEDQRILQSIYEEFPTPEDLANVAKYKFIV